MAWALSSKYCTNSTKKIPELRIKPNTRLLHTNRAPTSTQPQPPSGPSGSGPLLACLGSTVVMTAAGGGGHRNPSVTRDALSNKSVLERTQQA